MRSAVIGLAGSFFLLSGFSGVASADVVRETSWGESYISSTGNSPSGRTTAVAVGQSGNTIVLDSPDIGFASQMVERADKDASISANLMPKRRRWKSLNVPYFAPTKIRKESLIAARTWNTSGGRFRWRPVSRSRAKVHISINGIDAGRAFLSDGKSARIEISPFVVKRKNKSTFDRDELIGLITHEMGHVMGLDHTRVGCAVMWYAGFSGLSKCPYPKQGYSRCRFLEPDDVRGIIALRGGQAKKLGPRYCADGSSPPAPSDFRISTEVVNEDERYLLKFSWLNPDRKFKGTIGILGSWPDEQCPDTKIDHYFLLGGAPFKFKVSPGTPGSRQTLTRTITADPGSGSTSCFVIRFYNSSRLPGPPVTAYAEFND